MSGLGGSDNGPFRTSFSAIGNGSIGLASSCNYHSNLSFARGYSYSFSENGSASAVCVFLFGGVVGCGVAVFGMEADLGDVWDYLGHGFCV